MTAGIGGKEREAEEGQEWGWEMTEKVEEGSNARVIEGRNEDAIWFVSACVSVPVAWQWLAMCIVGTAAPTLTLVLRGLRSFFSFTMKHQPACSPVHT